MVDALALVNGINIDNVAFDIFDKTPLQTKARADAFQNAQDKASDYASFADLSLGRILTIDDDTAVSAPPIVRKGVAFAAALKVASDSTSVPLG